MTSDGAETTASEPFGRWLLAQRDRGDEIDALAEAARQDRGFPKDGSPHDVRKRLVQTGADSEIQEVMVSAAKIWRDL